jgi:hypothetical protein
VLHAIQATLDNSSKDNAADQVKDQAAQLQYLRECLSFASQERDQLLIMNKKMTSMLVHQTQQAAAAAAAAAAAGAAAAKGADSFTEALSSGQGAGAAVVAVAGKRAARLRRCFSYEVGGLDCLAAVWSELLLSQGITQGICTRSCSNSQCGDTDCIVPNCCAICVIVRSLWSTTANGKAAGLTRPSGSSSSSGTAPWT